MAFLRTRLNSQGTGKRKKGRAKALNRSEIEFVDHNGFYEAVIIALDHWLITNFNCTTNKYLNPNN